MKNIQLIALITGAAVLAGAAALIPLAILRAPRPRLLRAPDPISSNASPPNEFVIKKIEPPREKYLY